MDKNDISEMVEGVTRFEVSKRLQLRHGGDRGFSERTTRRFCHDVNTLVRFSVSSVTMSTCQISVHLAIAAWNHHLIPCSFSYTYPALVVPGFSLYRQGWFQPNTVLSQARCVRVCACTSCKHAGMLCMTESMYVGRGIPEELSKSATYARRLPATTIRTFIKLLQAQKLQEVDLRMSLILVLTRCKIVKTSRSRESNRLLLQFQVLTEFFIALRKDICISLNAKMSCL